MSTKAASDILTCHFAAGDDMREQDLVRALCVSRQPVREALLRLDGGHLAPSAAPGLPRHPISLAMRAICCDSGWRGPACVQ